MKGLMPKDGNWIYKVRVPRDLADHPDFRGREFIRRALGTKDKGVAEKNALIVAGEIESAFRRARDEIASVSKPRYIDSMTIHEMDSFLGDAVEAMKNIAGMMEQLPEAISGAAGALPERGRMIEWYASLKRYVLADHVLDALRDRYISNASTPRSYDPPKVDRPSSPDYDPRWEKKPKDRERERLLQQHLPSGREVDEFKTLEQSFGVPKVRRYTIGDLIDAFTTEPDREALQDSTKSTYSTPIELLADCLGRERKLDTVTKLDLKREIREGVLRCIPTYAKSPAYWPEYEGWTYPDIAKDFRARVEDGEEVTPMKEGSIHKYCNAIGTIFQYAADHGMIAANPADRLYSKSKDAQSPGKQPFSADALKLIFPSGWKPHDDVDWMLLLGLLHGLRGNEAAQLGCADILEHEGFMCLKIDSGEWKKTKNKPTKRIIPLHPKLIELGYWKLAAERRDAGNARVLSTVPYMGNYCYGSIRRDIKDRLDKLGVWDATHTFHSFRHTFQAAVKNCGVEHAKGQALGGWSQGGGSEQHYGNINGHGFEIATLVPEIAKIRYPISLFAG